MKNWGLCIRDLRKYNKLTQPELAERSGIKRSHLSRIEMGHYKGFKQDVLCKLADGLGMTPIQLAEKIFNGNGKDELTTANRIAEIKNQLRYLENELRNSKGEK